MSIKRSRSTSSIHSQPVTRTISLSSDSDESTSSEAGRNPPSVDCRQLLPEQYRHPRPFVEDEVPRVLNLVTAIISSQHNNPDSSKDQTLKAAQELRDQLCAEASQSFSSSAQELIEGSERAVARLRAANRFQKTLSHGETIVDLLRALVRSYDAAQIAINEYKIREQELILPYDNLDLDKVEHSFKAAELSVDDYADHGLDFFGIALNVILLPAFKWRELWQKGYYGDAERRRREQ